jgi:antitoxin component of RelBE/YafQ-DinJ toxin-antitoxin module
MSAQATEEFRVRIDRALVREANRVAEELGTTPGEIVRMLFVELVKRQAIPFPNQAETPETEILSSPRRQNPLVDKF